MTHREPNRVPIDLGSTVRASSATSPTTAPRTLGPAEEDAPVLSPPPGSSFPAKVRQRVGADFVDIGLVSLEAWERLDDGSILDERGVTWMRSGDGEPAALAGPLERDDITAKEILDWDGYPVADDRTTTQAWSNE